MAIAFAIAGIAFAIMRLLNKVTSMLEDVRHPVQNVSELTDLTLEDYKAVRSTVKTALNLKDSLSKLLSKVKKDDDEDEDED